MKFKNLKEIRHPLIIHKLSLLRNKDTGRKEFKELIDEIAMLMTYEITRELPLKEVEIETPLEKTKCKQILDFQIVLVPILRAGMGMVDGILRIVPFAKIGHIGLYRDHKTLQPVSYYFKIPPLKENHLFIILDPMLATGGSASFAADVLKQNGVKNIKFLNLIAAPEGVEKFNEKHSDIEIYTCSLDRELNDKGYILPGLGDAGDRLYGTV